MMKPICQSIAIACVMSVGLLDTPTTVAQGIPFEDNLLLQTQTANNNDPFDFSADGRSGNRTGGGSRSECPRLDPPLTALMPISNSAKTVSSHPTLWFYVPYTVDQAPIGEFVLQDEQRNDIVRRPFVLPETPGLVSVTVPDSLVADLNFNDWYLWYFNLYCDAEQSSAPVFTQGWIQRVPLDENASLSTDGRWDQYYAREGVWVDALHELALLRRDRPSDPDLLADWQTLLNALGVEMTDFPYEQPFVGNISLD